MPNIKVGREVARKAIDNSRSRLRYNVGLIRRRHAQGKKRCGARSLNDSESGRERTKTDQVHEISGLKSNAI